jgi:Ca2+/H+ antiporter
MAQTWQSVAAQEEMQVGSTYRLRLVMILPYSTSLHLRIIDALSGFNGAQKEYVVDTANVAAVMLEQSPTMGPIRPWELRIPFVKRSGNTPILVAMGILIAAIGAVVLIAAIFSKRLEKLTSTVGEEALTSLVPIGLVVIAIVFLLR